MINYSHDDRKYNRHLFTIYVHEEQGLQIEIVIVNCYPASVKWLIESVGNSEGFGFWKGFDVAVQLYALMTCRPTVDEVVVFYCLSENYTSWHVCIALLSPLWCL